LHFPIYSKFSSHLLENLPNSSVLKVLSYSSLLTSLGSSPGPPEDNPKKQVTSYKSPSRISSVKSKAISLQKLVFNPTREKPKKSPNSSKPKKFLKIFKPIDHPNSNLQLICQQAKLQKPASFLKKH
jgi:hypothetical protein